MPRVMIAQLGERVATMGLHLGGPATRRKLEPGEVVEMPKEFYKAIRERHPHMLQLTEDPVTRPWEFASEKEAKLTSRTFKVRTEDDRREQDEARAAVAARLAPKVEAEDEPPVEPVAPVGAPAGGGRAARREALANQQSAGAST